MENKANNQLLKRRGFRLFLLLLMTAFQANSAIYNYQASLSGSLADPPNQSPGVGFADLTFDSSLNTLRVRFSFHGLLFGAFAVHIHAATESPSVGTAGVALSLGGFPAGASFGNYTNILNLTLVSSYNAAYIATNGGTAADAEKALVAAIREGKAYVDVHDLLPIRGFIKPVSPVILTQPMGTFAKVGTNISFSVNAGGQQPLVYQWFFNGRPLAGQTATNLVLNNVQNNNAGAYSVIVTNFYGSEASATASLKILGDPANGNRPLLISPLDCPPKPPGVDSLIVIAHGWEFFGPSTDLSWVTNMASAIQQKVGSNWQVVSLNWIGNSFGHGAWTLTPDQALGNARILGKLYGQCLSQQGWKRIHFIAHSAGAALIDAASQTIKTNPQPPVVQNTFLDPFLSGILLGKSIFGLSADWSDNYFTKDSSGIWTQGQLTHAFNVDVTQLDPDAQPLQYNYIELNAGSTIAYSPSSSHGWPYTFYSNTVNNTAPSCAAGYGFLLSMEAGGSNNWTSANFLRNNPPVPLCGTVVVPQNQIPLRIDSAITISSFPNATSIVGVTLNGNGGAILFNTVPPPNLNGKKGGPYNGTDGSTNVPAWLTIGMTITNPVNFVQFDAAFTDSNLAQGLLTVYWDTNQIGMVDERVASTNSDTYRFPLPSGVTNDVYLLGFRLDSFSNTLSSIAVTNVTTGFAGVNQPITLGVVLFTNNTPILQITGASNYNYLVESSTNLVSWTPTALLVNTNGTVFFADKMATNSSTKFYRAMMP